VNLADIAPVLNNSLLVEYSLFRLSEVEDVQIYDNMISLLL